MTFLSSKGVVSWSAGLGVDLETVMWIGLGSGDSVTEEDLLIGLTSILIWGAWGMTIDVWGGFKLGYAGATDIYGVASVLS